MAAPVSKHKPAIELPIYFYRSTICSRIFVLLLQVKFRFVKFNPSQKNHYYRSCNLQIVFNQLIPDHESDGFKSPYDLIKPNATVLDSTINYTFGGFARWDGQYFLHIATLGYTHENCFAFFPLFPVLTKLVGHIVSFFSHHHISNWNTNLFSSFILNSILFSVAAKYLYKITVRITGSRRFAFQTWQFFCLSPATIFFSSPYSESLFSALTFGGVFYCLEQKFFKAALLFALSTASRSNGLLNVSFIIFYILLSVNQFNFTALSKKLIKASLSIFIIIIPFLLYQLYAFCSFCFQFQPSLVPDTIKDYLVSNKLAIPGEHIPEWCHNTIPLSYSAIQSTYWNNGFLRYFQLKQIPNFILASPVLALTILYSSTLVQRNYRTVLTRKRFKVNRQEPIFRLECAIFALHSTALALFTFFFAHVQVFDHFLLFFSFFFHLNLSYFV